MYYYRGLCMSDYSAKKETCVTDAKREVWDGHSAKIGDYTTTQASGSMKDCKDKGNNK